MRKGYEHANPRKFGESKQTSYLCVKVTQEWKENTYINIRIQR